MRQMQSKGGLVRLRVARAFRLHAGVSPGEDRRIFAAP
jgi:hypothetical protein